jgi:FKBP-type peptidyl-prolyl cis-trans isomerase FkpA
MTSESTMKRIYRSVVLALTALFPLASPAAEDSTAPAPTDQQKLVVHDTLVGTGAEAKPGATVKVNYTGWLYDPKASDHHGKQFDSSIGRGPFSFPLGAGRVIKGWDQGVAGMKVGGKRTLIIPASLGYGDRGAGDDIPPGATLVFDVELLGV